MALRVSIHQVLVAPVVVVTSSRLPKLVHYSEQ